MERRTPSVAQFDAIQLPFGPSNWVLFNCLASSLAFAVCRNDGPLLPVPQPKTATRNAACGRRSCCRRVLRRLLRFDVVYQQGRSYHLRLWFPVFYHVFSDGKSYYEMSILLIVVIFVLWFSCVCCSTLLGEGPGGGGRCPDCRQNKHININGTTRRSPPRGSTNINYVM